MLDPQVRSELEPLLDILDQKYQGLLNKLKHAPANQKEWKTFRQMIRDIAILHKRQRDHF